MLKNIPLIFMFLSSCSLLNLKHYNDLKLSDQQNYAIDKIDTSNHHKQDNGVYSINPEELNSLVSKNQFSLVVLHRMFCVGSHEIIKYLSERFINEIDLNLIVIGGDDQIIIEHYKYVVDKMPNVNKIYMLDNEVYGKINSWYENGTITKRTKRFFEDIKPKDFNNYVDDTYPEILFFNKQKKLIYYQWYFSCYETNCKDQVDSLSRRLNSSIKLNG
ncbi:hypothetical protein OAQ99_03960 [Candidatus Kapabacteria bacterium]|nr:hypothetical protein [Candidatus Kapabacteria bacterium]